MAGSTVPIATPMGEGKRSIPKAIRNEEVPDTIRGLSGSTGKIQKFLEVIMGDGQPPQIYNGVNDETLKLAPQESMQFGKALSRMLQGIMEADRKYGDCYMIYKVEVANGFYRVWLCTSRA